MNAFDHHVATSSLYHRNIRLTHWGRDKMAAISRRHFRMHFLEWKWMTSIKISLKFVPKVPINNIQALVQIMAWRWPGDKPLSEPMMVVLPTHICGTRPQWVNSYLWVCNAQHVYVAVEQQHGHVLHSFVAKFHEIGMKIYVIIHCTKYILYVGTVETCVSQMSLQNTKIVIALKKEWPVNFICIFAFGTK